MFSIKENKKLVFNVSKNLLIKDLKVEGTKSTDNAKVQLDCPDVTINGAFVSGTIYNCFELPFGKEHFPIKSFKASGVKALDTSIKHNIFNLYRFEDNAKVLILDSTFDLDVTNSNILRVSNLSGAKNVTITFKNINWTYENCASKETSDAEWAGLVLWQPAGTDPALNAANLEAMGTWTFIFDNCKYNGEKITKLEFGTIKQLLIGYCINSKTPEDLSNLVNIIVK